MEFTIWPLVNDQSWKPFANPNKEFELLPQKCFIAINNIFHSTKCINSILVNWETTKNTFCKMGFSDLSLDLLILTFYSTHFQSISTWKYTPSCWKHIALKTRHCNFSWENIWKKGQANFVMILLFEGPSSHALEV